MPVLVVVLWGGFVVNAVYCLSMMCRSAAPASDGDRTPLAAMLALAGAAGVVWALQFAFLKMGEPLCGEKAYVGFAIVMGASVFFSSFLGIFLGEWKGTGARTKGLLATGLALLAASILLPVVAR
jgi:L-rhamnose-H+ transport protein